MYLDTDCKLYRKGFLRSFVNETPLTNLTKESLDFMEISFTVLVIGSLNMLRVHTHTLVSTGRDGERVFGPGTLRGRGRGSRVMYRVPYFVVAGESGSVPVRLENSN